MNKENILQEIKNTEDSIKSLSDKIEQLKAELNKPDGRWKPEDIKFYYSISIYGDVEENLWADSRIDNYRYNTRNCFKTAEEAQKKLDYIKTHYELMDIADELNAGQKIDWNNGEQEKKCLSFNYDLNRITFCYSHYDNCVKNEGTICCLSDKFKDVAIERIGEDRLIQYLTYSEQ